ncbi:MAG: ATP-grasp domain-containing protein [Planctomycetes bacterium]|nr:ATP-grasp domain-containing protein [Planctomycetota bacterium]
MSKPVNIMVTGSGCTTGQSIIKALRMSSLDCRIIAIDTHSLAVGLYRADGGYLVPRCDDPEYIPRLIEICRQEKLDLILVGSTPEVPVLARHAGEIKNEADALVAVSDVKTVDICYNKFKTSQFLQENNLPGPLTVDAENEKDVQRLVESLGYPVLLKPQQGCAARGVHLIQNEAELEFYLSRMDELCLVQEYLPDEDEEYTCGLFYDKNKSWCGDIVMKRELVNGGTYRGMVDDYAEIRNYIRQVGDALAPTGPINIQLRQTPKGPRLFEINPRFSCSDAMRVQLGYNAAEAAVRHFLWGEDIRKYLRWKKGISIRYANEVVITIDQWEKLKTNKHLDAPVGKVLTGF